MNFTAGTAVSRATNAPASANGLTLQRSSWLCTIGTGTRMRSAATCGIPRTQTDDVSTTPVTGGGPTDAAPLAAEIDPLLVPTGQTGSGERDFSIATMAPMSFA